MGSPHTSSIASTRSSSRGFKALGSAYSQKHSVSYLHQKLQTDVSSPGYRARQDLNKPRLCALLRLFLDNFT